MFKQWLFVYLSIDCCYYSLSTNSGHDFLVMMLML